MKLLLTSIFLFCNIYLFSQKVWFTNVSYDCSYALNCSNNVVVDTITFKFKVNYNNKKAVNKDRGPISIWYGYSTRFHKVGAEIHFVVKIDDLDSIKIMTNDKYLIYFDKGIFFCKIGVIDQNIPDIHYASINKYYMNDASHLKYHDQERIYFGRLNKTIYEKRAWNIEFYK